MPMRREAGRKAIFLAFMQPGSWDELSAKMQRPMDSPNLYGQASCLYDGTEMAMPKDIVFTIRPRGFVSALLVYK